MSAGSGLDSELKKKKILVQHHEQTLDSKLGLIRKESHLPVTDFDQNLIVC